jgi:hypothetical protein
MENLPPEIWIIIFEKLEIPELYLLNQVSKIWSQLVARVARQTIRGVLKSAKATTVDGDIDSMGLPFSTDTSGYVSTCFPFLGRCYSRALSDQEMTLEMVCRTHCGCLSLPYFHSCRDGTAPFQVIKFFVEHTATQENSWGLVDRLRLTYSTRSLSIPVRLVDEIGNGSLTLRKISHRIPFFSIQFQTTRMRYDEWFDLPPEWAGFFEEEIEVSLEFMREPEQGHLAEWQPHPQFYCEPFRLTSFKAIWTFRQIPGFEGNALVPVLSIDDQVGTAGRAVDLSIPSGGSVPTNGLSTLGRLEGPDWSELRSD